MPKPNPEGLHPAHMRKDLPQGLPEAAARIGLVELRREEILTRHTDIIRRLKTGLGRQGQPEIADGGMAKDGGFAALRSGVELVPDEVWRKVPDGTVSYVASIGGTNSEYYRITKESNSKIKKVLFGKKTYDDDADKPMTFADFIGKTVDPVAEAYNSQPGNKGKLRLGVSLAFAHKNKITPDGIDAEFIPIEQDGTMPKKWKITDWPELSDADKSFIKTIKAGFANHGINPVDVGVVLPDRRALEATAVFNDTLGVLMDSSAARKAMEDGLQVLKIGGVGGTGTNLGVDQDGLVNLEIGRYPLQTAANGKADPITERALDILHTESAPGTPRGNAEMETETGGMYMSIRLRAGLQILGEEGLLPNAKALEAWAKKESKTNPAFMSELATGESKVNGSYYGDPTLQYLAQGILHRAGQNFGLTSAAVAEVLYPDRANEPYAALLVEGSFVNEAAGVKQQSEATALSLGQPIRIYKADSVNGIGAFAMSWRHLHSAA